MKKALIITCNDSYDYNTRTRYVEKTLKKSGYSVEHLISDFDHRSKKPYRASHEGTINYVHVPSYTKNLSPQRIWSHIRFGQHVKRFVMKSNYDLIYHCSPPNYTIKQLSKCKKKRQFKLITEVGDMWPESIPIGNGMKKILKIPFCIWSALRDKYLYNSDAVIAECDLFRDTIKKNSGIEQIQTLYFCKEYVGDERKITYEQENAISLCYLGSINNIIDVDIIGKLIKAIAEKTTVFLHIIGDGEKRQMLIDTAIGAGAKVEYHGIVFNEHEKRKVFNQCHYALNIMKPEVFVGMTMKSLDYFSAGLPLINNIGGDVWKMVETEKCGFNINTNNITDKIDELVGLTNDEYQFIVESVKETHKKYFSIECVEEVIASLV